MHDGSETMMCKIEGFEEIFKLRTQMTYKMFFVNTAIFF